MAKCEDCGMAYSEFPLDTTIPGVIAGRLVFEAKGYKGNPNAI